MTVQNGKYKPSPGLGLNLEDKIELSIELARIALECPTCRGLFKQAIENHEIATVVKMNTNADCRQDGGLTASNSQREKGCNYNENSRS